MSLLALGCTTMNQPEWWRGAVIYQIYPRSFADSNGDGVGDLEGITAHLGHVASLGVDTIWLSPFFRSPMADFGYDICDYRDVDPLFGTLAEFDALVLRAHELGLKVIIDQVYSHSSTEHPWFVESRSSRDNPKADWYVWADPKPDGSPPNNWQSVFGGPAWSWDARRGQYYLHNFLSSQPDLNFHHPEVVEAALDTARFWLERGVDGFRLDAINYAFHDPVLRDNPPAPDDGRPRTRPADYQQPQFNRDRPEMVGFLERLRFVTDHYGGSFTVAEVVGRDAEAEMHRYTAPGRLSSAYGFNFLYADRLTPGLVRAAMEKWPGEPGEGWPSWAFENHDAPRAVSRWVDPLHRAAFARMKLLLLLSLRGNAFLYQGEELGLTQVEIPFEALQDPEAIANWPLTLGRDGARTPMPWRADAPGAGFTTGRPWLPIGADHLALAVDRQDRDPHSLLNLARRLIALRRDLPALARGSLTIRDASENRLVFERDQLTCAFNLGPDPVEWHGSGKLVVEVNGASATQLPGFGAIILDRAI
ncbi:alpha-glucosidase [Nostoc sp. 3335mG]|nr:alpha-glucosidase [Nostoc sp. 3335mG]